MKRLVVVLCVWALGLAGVLTSVVLPVGAAAAMAVTTPGGFASLAPFRLLDTRSGVGAAKVAVAAGGTVHLQVTGRGGVPASGVSAVVLNVTVTAPTSAGFVTVYGDGSVLPTASNLNFVKGQTVPNLVIAPVGTNGKVDLYNGSGGTVQLIGDVSGYYLAGAPTVAGAFGSLAPARLLDTRTGVGAPKVAVAASGTVHLQVTGRGGVPASGVSAVVLNVTVTAPTAPGFVTVYGDGSVLPTASSLNFVAGQTIPNMVLVKLGPGGTVTFYNAAGTVNVIADLVGYYQPGTGAGFTGTAPARVLDTRSGLGAPKAKLGAGRTLTLTVPGLPAGATAVALNVTVTGPTAASYLSVYPGGTTRPTASSLNFVAAQTIPNMVLVKLGPGGTVTFYNAAGTVNVIADLVGYYAP
ncbi:MAG: hypothetical protein HHJ11_18335 [Phycicoccus sp.]|nr:hypothetical protein [Phycicoccus sp.]